MEGKIDMVITKSISRFARNTLDCLKYIRQLKDKNIPVFYWHHDMEGDDEGYWQEYLDNVLLALKKNNYLA